MHSSTLVAAGAVEDERQKRANRDTRRQSHLADGDVDGARVESQRGAKAQDFDKTSTAAKVKRRQPDVDASSASRGRQPVSNSQRRKKKQQTTRSESDRSTVAAAECSWSRFMNRRGARRATEWAHAKRGATTPSARRHPPVFYPAAATITISSMSPQLYLRSRD